jgi:transcription termination/antitermination protein NusG
MASAAFSGGEAVRIIDGPFINFVGVVREVQPDAARVTVAIGVRGRDVLVDLDYYRREAIR